MKIYFTNGQLVAKDADEFMINAEGTWIDLYKNNLIVGTIKASDVLGIFLND